MPLSVQHGYHELGAVVHPQGDEAVAEASGDYHIRLPDGVEAGVILRQEALAGRVQRTYERQSHLAAVGVAAQDQVSSVCGIGLYQLRPVRQQDIK